jgi:adhesin/invasin
MSSRPRWLARTSAACFATAALSGGAVAGTVGASTASAAVPHQARIAVSVTASQYRLPADGKSTAVIAVRVLSNGHAARGRYVSLSATYVPRGTSASCGSFARSAGRTNASGFIRTTYTASTSSGFCDITAANGGHRGGTTVIQLNPTYAGLGVTISASASPGVILADGKSTSTLTVKVSDRSGAVANDPVELQGVSPTGACGNLSADAGFTGSDGTFHVTYTASTTPGTCRVAARGAFAGRVTVPRVVIAQRRTATTVSAVNVYASPSVILANGKSTSTVAVKVIGNNGAGLRGATVALGVAYSPTSTTAACGSLSHKSVRTDAHGSARVGYRASTKAGFCVVTATSASVSGTAVIVQRDPGFTVAVSSPSPATVAGDGKSTSTFTLSVASTLGPVSGDPVEIVGTPSKAGSCGTFNPSESTTDASGSVKVTYTASSAAGVCHVTAAEALTGQTSKAVDITQS